MKNNLVRIIAGGIFVTLLIAILTMSDVATYLKRINQEIEIPHTDDHYNFRSLGIEVSTYNTETKSFFDSDESVEDNILLLRTSQIINTELLTNKAVNPYNTILIVCDTEWKTQVYSCNSNNFESSNDSTILPIDDQRELAAGYISENNSRYFFIPEFLLNNILKYPILFDLISGISTSQHYNEISFMNDAEIRQHSGTSLFLEFMLFVILLNIIIIFLLNTIVNRFPNSKFAFPRIIPLVSSIITAVLILYMVNSIPYIESVLTTRISNIANIEKWNTPNIFWVIIGLLFFTFVFYTGFELDLYIKKRSSWLISIIESQTNVSVINKITIILLSIIALQVVRKDIDMSSPTVLNYLVFATGTFIISLCFRSKDTSKILVKNILNKYLPGNVLANIYRVIYVVVLIILVVFIRQYSEAKSFSKNRMLFEPLRQYFTTPYSKLIRPGEVFHEYKVDASEAIFIDNYMISKPGYSDIHYIYSHKLKDGESFGYLEAEEYMSIRPLLNDRILNSLKSSDITSYLRIKSKSDINTPISITITLICSIEDNTAINLEKFRLSYDKTSVIYSINELNNRRKCTKGDHYKINIIKDLSELTTYAYDDEILKLSADNQIISLEILPETPGIQIEYLSLISEHKYVIHEGQNRHKLILLTEKIENQGLQFITTNNQIDIGEYINILKRRGLISNVATIDSLNKYTLIKYIK